LGNYEHGKRNWALEQNRCGSIMVNKDGDKVTDMDLHKQGGLHTHCRAYIGEPPLEEYAEQLWQENTPT